MFLKDSWFGNLALKGDLTCQYGIKLTVLYL